MVHVLVKNTFNTEEFYMKEFQENLEFIFSCYQNVYEISFEHKFIDLMIILVDDHSNLEVFEMFSTKIMDIYNKND